MANQLDALLDARIENAKVNPIQADELKLMKKTIARTGDMSHIKKILQYDKTWGTALESLGDYKITTPIGIGLGAGMSMLANKNPYIGGGIGALVGALTPKITEEALRHYLDI